jgi:hypothetical protein
VLLRLQSFVAHSAHTSHDPPIGRPGGSLARPGGMRLAKKESLRNAQESKGRVRIECVFGADFSSAAVRGLEHVATGVPLLAGVRAVARKFFNVTRLGRYGANALCTLPKNVRFEGADSTDQRNTQHLLILRGEEVRHGDVTDLVHGSAEGRAVGAMRRTGKVRRCRWDP